MNNNLKSQVAPYSEDLRSKSKPRLSRKNYQLNQYEKQLGQTAIKCWNSWKNSSQGRNGMQTLQSAPIDEMQKTLKQAGTSSHFSELVTLISTISGKLDWPIKSFSIGINFEAELIIGISGTLGVAINPTNLSGDSSAFLSLGVTEGVDEGAMGGVQFGFWTTEPEDMGGWSIGLEISVVDYGGFEAGAYWGTSGFLGIAVAPGAGEEDGIDVQESYTFVLADGALGIPPIYQMPAKHFLILTKLSAKNIAAGDGKHNEIMFKFIPDDGATYPYPSWDYFAMAEGDEWKCGRSVRFNDKVKIKLYDVDDTSSDDKLGEITIKLSDLKKGDDKKFSIKSKHGLDERDFHMHATLIY